MLNFDLQNDKIQRVHENKASKKTHDVVWQSVCLCLKTTLSPL